jgi:hypothetical protein
MYRASCRLDDSVSPPPNRRQSASSGLGVFGRPSAKHRMLNGSRSPAPPVELPMMSLVNMPAMLRPCAFAWDAKCAAPNSPCSSPATAMNTRVASNRRVAITRAISSTAATPDASSLAPGASDTASMTLVGIES